jgi:hypothetical protein
VGAYFAMTVIYAVENENYLTIPFLVLFVVGYWYTGLMSLLQGRFRKLPASWSGSPIPLCSKTASTRRPPLAFP